MVKKATGNPMGDTPVLDAKMCAFCNKKELAVLGVTGMNYPMCERCYKKALQRQVVWDDNTTLKTLKSLN